MQTFVEGLWDLFVKNPLLALRTFIWFLLFGILIILWITAKKRSKKRSLTEEAALVNAYYEKSSEGEYPWEADKNDHPSSIKKGAKPMSTDFLPKRGRWS